MPAPAPARVLTLAGAQVEVFHDSATAALAAAERMARTIRATVAERGRAVLGLATGGSPKPVYARLVALHREGALSFKDVTTYNLDEYYPVSPLDPRSYHAYMHEHLFSLVDIAPNSAHVLDGTVPPMSALGHAEEYERWIEWDGGLDLQLLGLGRNGHIGFNEPDELRSAAEVLKLPGRMVPLHPTTLLDHLQDFGGDESKVILFALTIGIAAILAARSILVLAFGPHKAEAVARSLTGPIDPEMPGSFLQKAAGKVTWMLDEAAARGL